MLQEAVVLVMLAGGVAPGHRAGQHRCLRVRRHKLLHRDRGNRSPRAGPLPPGLPDGLRSAAGAPARFPRPAAGLRARPAAVRVAVQQVCQNIQCRLDPALLLAADSCHLTDRLRDRASGPAGKIQVPGPGIDADQGARPSAGSCPTVSTPRACSRSTVRDTRLCARPVLCAISVIGLCGCSVTSSTIATVLAATGRSPLFAVATWAISRSTRARR